MQNHPRNSTCRIRWSTLWLLTRWLDWGLCALAYWRQNRGWWFMFNPGKKFLRKSGVFAHRVDRTSRWTLFESYPETDRCNERVDTNTFLEPLTYVCRRNPCSRSVRVNVHRRLPNDCCKFRRTVWCDMRSSGLLWMHVYSVQCLEYD